MKLGVPIWQNRIAPVFDEAQWIAFYRIEAGGIEAVGELEWSTWPPAAKIMRLLQEGVEAVVCGAISRPFEAMLTSAGVQVIAGVCGPAPAVLGQLARGRAPGATFRMPGCGRRRRRRFGGVAPSGPRRRGRGGPPSDVGP